MSNKIKLSISIIINILLFYAIVYIPANLDMKIWITLPTWITFIFIFILSINHSMNLQKKL